MVAEIPLRQIVQRVVGTHSRARIGASSTLGALRTFVLSAMCCAEIAGAQLTPQPVVRRTALELYLQPANGWWRKSYLHVANVPER